ncbi:MAG: hypothetical protein RIS29_3230 [Bacteroidota bacterium]|jgi:uncharacterized surface protein with fasciclin (FAS1) repeats
MRKLLKLSGLLSLILILTVRCSNDKDAYFLRPGWLEPPIYDVLKEKGHFTNYLKCVDKTLYSSVLQGAGLYTVFAPNDSAFNVFLTKNGYNSIADIPDSTVEKIVSYSICYSTYTLDSLGVRGGYKYKTQYYALPYRDAEFNNEWVVDQTMENGWTTAYNNYKFLPTFTNAFFSSNTPALTAADYNVFFPNVTFNGKNVQGGQILNADMRAENGIVHEVSTVNLPLNNIADIIKKPEFSLYRSLVDAKDNYGDYLFRTYLDINSPTMLKAIQKIMPKENIDRVFIKFYTGLNYSLNLENVLDESGKYTPEKSGYTMIVPTNDALTEYMNLRVLKYYADAQSLPSDIVQTLIMAHMVPSLVWPANYASSVNGNGDYLNGEGNTGKQFSQSGISGATLASNGFVYHSSKAISSRIFESVYSELFINPAHKWANIGFVNNFNSSLREDLQKCSLNGFMSERYTLITFDDQLLKDDGFSYNSTDNTFSHSVSGVNANNRLTRLLREHVFEGLQNNEVKSEISDFATTGISNEDNWNFTVTSYGDPVRYKNNQMQAAGNIEDNSFVNLTKINDTYLNGTVWKADKPLQYSPRVTGTSDDKKFKELSLWEYLDRARTQNPNVKLFVDYLQKCIKTYPDDATSTALDGISAEQFYTVLMPNNTAMQAALSAKVIPPIDSVGSAFPTAFARAAFFINSHIIQGRVLVDDNKSYLYPANATSLNKALVPVVAKVNNERLGLTNQSLMIEVSKVASGSSYFLNWLPQNVTQGTKVLVSGASSGTMRVQRGKPTGTTILNNYRSNRIACKAILHEVNNYFTFKAN